MYLGVLSVGGSAVSRFGGIAAALEGGELEVIWILTDGVEFRACHLVDGSNIRRFFPLGHLGCILRIECTCSFR